MRNFFDAIFFKCFVLLLRFNKSKLACSNANKPRLFWGPDPILNIKYWSNSLSTTYHSKTVVSEYYIINKKEDYDIYTDDILFKFKFSAKILRRYEPYFLTYYALKNYDIFHLPFTGLFLGKTKFWKEEAKLFKEFGKKTVLLPYGSDAYMYSKMKNESFQNALLISYPESARNENKIEERVQYWSRYADFIPGGFMIDGFSRWDVVAGNFVSVDTESMKSKSFYSSANGLNEEVCIVHCPNHRGAKGTEFVIEAVEALKKEGLKINFLLLEKVKNDEVLNILINKADILVEQLIMGYGLNAIEGMATGTVVVSNLSIEAYTRIFRRYGTLNENPIVSATPENVKDVLRELIGNPKLRETLGIAGRQFSEKYHSPKFSKYLFSNIYKKIWYDETIDFSKMFHPLDINSYNNQSPKVKHPLKENNLPLKTENKQ